jgi:hypothetical protein
MDAIPVKSPFDEPEYNSPKEAIDAARKPKRIEEVDAIKGCVIESGTWTPRSLSLHILGNSSITFYLENSRIKLQVGSRAVEPQSDSAETALLFSASRERYIWKKEKIIAKRLNRKLQGVFPGANCFYLYAEACPPLLVARVVNETTNQDLLYWDDSD